MPSNYSPASRSPAATVSILADGDAVNQDDLYKEASPGGTPKLTLAYLADCIAGLADGSAPQVAAYSGTIWTIAAGALSTFLHALADKAAKVDFANSFTATQTFQNITAVIASATGIVVAQTFERAQHNVSASATTYTYQTTDGPIIWLDGWHHASGQIDITLADPASAGSKRFEVDVFFNPTTSGDHVHVKRADTTLIGTLSNAGWMRFRWDGTMWRSFGGVPFSGTFSDLGMVA